jgi:hypothetical protein
MADASEDFLQTQGIKDSRFVEILARCCRVWMDPHSLDPDAVKQAEVVIQVRNGHPLAMMLLAADYYDTACFVCCTPMNMLTPWPHHHGTCRLA